jgi:hypothetical protein
MGAVKLPSLQPPVLRSCSSKPISAASPLAWSNSSAIAAVFS